MTIALKPAVQLKEVGYNPEIGSNLDFTGRERPAAFGDGVSREWPL